MKNISRTKVKENIPVERPGRANFWRMNAVPKEKIVIGDHAVHCVVVCKNCGPGLIRVTYKSFSRESPVDLPSGRVHLFWVYDNQQVEGDPIYPTVVDMQFMPIF